MIMFLHLSLVFIGKWFCGRGLWLQQAEQFPLKVFQYRFYLQLIVFVMFLGIMIYLLKVDGFLMPSCDSMVYFYRQQLLWCNAPFQEAVLPQRIGRRFKYHGCISHACCMCLAFLLSIICSFFNTSQHTFVFIELLGWLIVELQF